MHHSYIWRVFTLVGDNGGFERRAAGLLSRATLWYGAAATAWLACALLWIPLAAAAPYSLIVALSLLMGSLCLSAIAFALVHLTMRATELKDDGSTRQSEKNACCETHEKHAGHGDDHRYG